MSSSRPRVIIAQMEHSPLSTRRFASYLLGRKATVVGSLRNALVVVKLDGGPGEAPAGTRRWSVHQADVERLTARAAPRKPPGIHRIGITRSGDDIVHHAVPAGSALSLCGVLAAPLPVLEWSVPFAPTTRRAYPRCVQG